MYQHLSYDNKSNNNNNNNRLIEMHNLYDDDAWPVSGSCVSPIVTHVGTFDRQLQNKRTNKVAGWMRSYRLELILDKTAS